METAGQNDTQVNLITADETKEAQLKATHKQGNERHMNELNWDLIPEDGALREE